MIKQLTFVRRAPGVDAAAFAARWRALARRQYEDLAGELRPARLEHCIVDAGRTPAPWHGVALAWFENAPAAAASALATASGDGVGTVLDAAATLTVPVESRCVFGEAWLAERRRHAAEPAVLLLGFIERAPWLSRTQFRDYWWERHRPLANTLVPPALQPAAYVHDYALPDAPVEWDGCGELYEATLENARARAAWFDSAAAAPLAVDEARFLVRDTRRVVLTTHEILV